MLRAYPRLPEINTNAVKIELQKLCAIDAKSLIKTTLY